MMQSQISSKKSLASPQFSHLDEERYRRFLHKICKNQKCKYVALSFSCLCDDPLQWFHAHNQKHAFHYYWERPAASFAVAALGSALELNARGHDRFTAIHVALENADAAIQHLDITSQKNYDIHFVGGFSFFDELKDSSWQGFEPASLNLPKYTVLKRENECIASVAISVEGIKETEPLHQKISAELHSFLLDFDDYEPFYEAENVAPLHYKKDNSTKNEYLQWTRLVKSTQEMIAAHKVEKIVLSRQLQLKLPPKFDVVAALNHLRDRFPDCYTFLMKNKDSHTFIGSTPELLLSVKGNEVRTDALAGSVARGWDEQSDEAFESELLGSEKNREEHEYVVRDIENSLRPFVAELESGKKPQIKKLPNVQHLYSPIYGQLKENTGALSLLGTLHPTPAMGGAPRDESLAFIQKYESFNRGLFASPVGWITPHGSAEFAVAIRSGLINNDTAQLFAGCGIVADSDARAEWEEGNLKFKPMLSALNYD